METSLRDLVLEAADTIDELTIELQTARRAIDAARNTAVMLEQQSLHLTDAEVCYLARHLEGHAPISQEEEDSVHSAILKIDARAMEIINRDRLEQREANGKL